MQPKVNRQMNDDEAQTYIENVMVSLNPNGSADEHRQYLAGVIDTLSEFNIIQDSTRDALYPIYAC